MTLEPTKEQRSRVKSFAIAHFSKKGLQGIFDDEQALLLLLQIPIEIKLERFENLILFLLSAPHSATQFLRLLEARSPQFIAKFFNAIGSMGHSGLAILLNWAMSGGSVETVHNLFKKHETLYRAVTCQTWYLKSWYHKSETSSNEKQCPLEIIVDSSGQGGIEFLSDLLTHNCELFGLEFVDLLNCVFINTNSHIYHLVDRCDASTFLLRWVEKNKSVLNEKLVKALCEPVGEEGMTVLWIMCSQIRYHPFINHLLNKSLASPKFELSRELVIQTLCRESQKNYPLGMLIFNLYNNGKDQILKNFINQYVKFFNPKLLGKVLSSFSKVIDISGAATTSLFMTLNVGNGREVLAAILTKLPGVAAYITPDALGLNFSPSERDVLRETLGEDWDNSLMRLFILNPKLLQYHILKEKTHGVPLFHRLLAVDNGLSALKKAFMEVLKLRSEITMEDLFTPYSYGEGEARSLYFKLFLDQQGVEILDLIFAANPALFKVASFPKPPQGLLPTFSMFQLNPTPEKQPISPSEEGCNSSLDPIDEHEARPAGGSPVAQEMYAGKGI